MISYDIKHKDAKTPKDFWNLSWKCSFPCRFMGSTWPRFIFLKSSWSI